MRTEHFFKFFVTVVMIGLFSPSLILEEEQSDNKQIFSFSFLTTVEARGFGGGMRGGGMHFAGGMRGAGMGERHFSGMHRGGMSNGRRMGSLSSSRYHGGNFARSNTNSFGLSTARSAAPSHMNMNNTMPKRTVGRTSPRRMNNAMPKQISKRKVTSDRPVSREASSARKAEKTRTSLGNRPDKGNKPGRGKGFGKNAAKRKWYSNHRGYYGGYGYGPYYGYGGYGTGMMTGMAIGTLIATLPSGCSTETIGDTTYKECSGDYYEPVFEDGELQYRLVNSPL
jgi:hypothetical protein